MTYFKGQGYNQPATKVTPATRKVVKSGAPAAGVAKLGFKAPGASLRRAAAVRARRPSTAKPMVERELEHDESGP
jgi:hypothetical protein